MKRSLAYYYIPGSVLLLSSCIRNINVPIRSVPPILVVEGLITTDSAPYTINLSYSGPFSNTSQANLDTSQHFITDANVTIEDDLGDSTPCSWVGLGTYQSTDSNFIGTVGRTYKLKVYLSNGKTYVSKLETITAIPPIDSLTIIYDSADITGIQPPPLVVSLNTHDPGGTQNFYRWTASGYFPRKSWGAPCNGFVDPPCTNPYMCTCHALCEQDNPDNQVTVLSNQFIEGREIILPIYYSPVYWFGEHFIEINQYSLSLDAYQFWEQYLAQTNRTGSILDPLPAPLTGNIYNQADSIDLALGIFSASAVYTKKVVVVLYFSPIQYYDLESTVAEYIVMGDCGYVYPGALPDETDPPGWENAQEIGLNIN
jgi:hypothetical protein